MGGPGVALAHGRLYACRGPRLSNVAGKGRGAAPLDILVKTVTIHVMKFPGTAPVGYACWIYGLTTASSSECSTMGETLVVGTAPIWRGRS